VGASKP